MNPISRPARPAGARTAGLLAAVLLVMVCGSAALRSAGQAPAAGQASAPGKAPSTAAANSCLSCHRPLITQATVHAPASDCTTCHEQQGTAHRFKAVAEGADLCTTCHEVRTQADKYVHGPVATGDCVSCHNPHASAAPKLLRASGSALCDSCHQDMKAGAVQKRYMHEPVKTDCTGCHSPHASPFKYQLKAEGSALCFRCHDKLQQAIGAAAGKHSAVSTGRACLNCHEPHAADLRPQLRSATAPLCLKCHDKELPTRAGTIIDIKGWLASNPNLHGPIQQEDCVACHRPHESEHFRLLKQDYPRKFYSPFDPANYELCFNCHQPDLVRVARSATVTGFRDGDRNLHFLHVNQPEKGRTCRACHEVHSSNRPRHIRDKVPFGSWALPIKFESAADGGKCSPGCHVPVEYRRTAAVAPVPSR